MTLARYDICTCSGWSEPYRHKSKSRALYQMAICGTQFFFFKLMRAANALASRILYRFASAFIAVPKTNAVMILHQKMQQVCATIAVLYLASKECQCNPQ